MVLSRILVALVGASLLAPGLASAQDIDADGAPDASDAYPCDPLAQGQAFAPAEGAHGMLQFEDQWPDAASDLDFNDVVVTYSYEVRLDAAGHARRVRATFNVLAIGGVFTNGLGLHLPVPTGAVTAVTRRVGDAEAAPLTPSALDAELTVDVLANLRDLFGGAPGPLNSVIADGVRAPGRVEVDVELAPGVALDLGAAPFDVFVYRTHDRGHEIHTPRYPGTARMDAARFGTGADGSSPNRWFVDRAGLPFALHLPVVGPFPAEGVAVSQLFPRVASFAASGGLSDRDFYLRDVDGAAAFRADGFRAEAPARDCRAVASRTSGVYWVDPDGDGPQATLQTYCDFDTPGGPWQLALAYAHAAGANAGLVVGAAPTDPSGGYSQLASATIASLEPEAVRLYCETDAHPRRVHFSTEDPAVVAYLSGQGRNSVAAWAANFTELDGHTAHLPAGATSGFDEGGEGRMVYFPIYRAGTWHWGVRGSGSRWECDDYAGGPQHRTLHQVWIRSRVGRSSGAGPLTPSFIGPAVATFDRCPLGSRASLPGASCAGLRDAGTDTSGVYWLDPDGDGGAAPFEAYCDQSTAGGGWTLALAYAHAAGTNPALQAGARPLDPAGGFGHLSRAQVAALGASEARLYCDTSGLGRRMHFTTASPTVLGYFEGRTGNAVGAWTSGFTLLGDHTANLPAQANSGWSNAGEDRMTAFPFYVAGAYHWGVRGAGDRWECDDYARGGQHRTLHQIWLR